MSAVLRPIFPVALVIALASPDALLASMAHNGLPAERGFTPSDAALFGFAVVSVWLARRSMRARARARKSSKD